MNRKQFMQSHGATCRNWNWSWSFINEAKRQVIFGAWDKHTAGGRALILDESWVIGASGRKSPGYLEAREYLRRVEEDGYELYTFPMIFSSSRQDEHGLGPATIKAFGLELALKTLIRVGPRWFASDENFIPPVAEELDEPHLYAEGARTQITINGYERSRKAREACLRHHGRRCAVCSFSGTDAYGAVGNGIIHVHHVVPVAEIKAEYILDPIRDLVPVCPNYHAVIHSTRPALSIEHLRSALRTST